MKLGEIRRLLGSQERSTRAAVDLSEREPLGYSIDSRSLRAGELFFAIKGENRDAHRFVDDALRRGALGAVVTGEFLASSSQADTGVEAWLLPVADTLAALQSLAASVRGSWRGREVAITGSVGKTSTKELTASTLDRIGRVNRTTGNLNNEYGLPLSILKMESDGAHAVDFDYAVLEMGMNHKGEIARLAKIAPPDVGAVTNVAPVHLEFFDSIEGIAAAKAELVLGIKSGGFAVLNADDALVAGMKQLRDDIRVHTFGIQREAAVRARRIEDKGLGGTRFALQTPRGEVDVVLPLAGRHQVYNALAAAAVADVCEVPLEAISDALAEASSPKMRGEVTRFARGFTLVDDSYNSNPRALIEMVTTIAASEGFKRKIVVAGEMLELGETSAELHRVTGRRLAELGIDLLIGVRGFARELVEGAREAGISAGSAVFSETPEQAAEIVAREARAGDVILVKGSRGVKTEAVIARLKEKFQEADRRAERSE
ncbi:MAG TPA: UDP-N-acetylmuramoyl-tripeptide--D-alanyl-D-alanine ligase [Blastocatellia bacterium]|nr:UDP-N-acetylmuramoyl-tripeptide--D-alanyl-D-alanine ligase [Blastocatellia bacterium]